MNVLLTGATGFIGAQVLERLVARGDVVRVLVRPETLAQPQKVKHVTQRDRVELVVGSLANRTELAKAAEGLEVVYHLAGLLPRPHTKPEDLIRVNVHGTENLLQASVTGSIRRFLFISSVMVYDQTLWHMTESLPLQAHGPYGKTKIAAENLISRYHRRPGLEYVILRPSPVYGLGMLYGDQLLGRILSHPRLALSRGMGRVMQWVHVNDVADAVLLAGTRPEAANNTFNVAGDETVTHRDLVAMVLCIAGRGSWESLFPIRPRTRGNYPFKYDISKAGRLLGFTPKVRLKEGLAEIVAALDRARPMTRRPAWGHGWLRWMI
jgi:nucleoside-diphosphate-sugar epimerase